MRGLSPDERWALALPTGPGPQDYDVRTVEGRRLFDLVDGLTERGCTTIQVYACPSEGVDCPRERRGHTDGNVTDLGRIASRLPPSDP
jgi:hypothetical protein